MRFNYSAHLLLATLVALSPVASLVQNPQNPLNDSRYNQQHPRRSFLEKSVVGTLLTSTFSARTVPVLVGGSSIVSSPTHAIAAESVTSTITQIVKVTPVAHTFVSSSGSNNVKASIKPLRENDATRYFTNARVVHLFYNGDTDKAIQTTRDIVQLTVERKAGQGPGVTPGTVHFLTNNGDGMIGPNDDEMYSNIQGLSILKDPSLKYALMNLPVGDVVFVAPKKSNGTIINGMLVEQSALTNGLEVGGMKSGGVISCLINGPKDPESIAVLDGGYTTSTILWYGQS